jgi:hypothetical protein
MRALAIALLGLPALGAAPPGAGEGVLQNPMNRYREAPDCLPIPRQVAGADREYKGNRLDQQPPGRLLHAVERKVGECRTVTFVADERLRRPPGR